MINAIDLEMPSVEEVLGGRTQGGVPRPAVLDRGEAPALTATDAACQVKLARAEVEAAYVILTAARDRMETAHETLRVAEAAFYKAVDRDFLS